VAKASIRSYEEAASVFGATAWQRFRRITLPLLGPSIQSALIPRTVLAFEALFSGADQPGVHQGKSKPGLRGRSGVRGVDYGDHSPRRYST
jgi:hypothetical protein